MVLDAVLVSLRWKLGPGKIHPRTTMGRWIHEVPGLFISAVTAPPPDFTPKVSRMLHPGAQRRTDAEKKSWWQDVILILFGPWMIQSRYCQSLISLRSQCHLYYTVSFWEKDSQQQGSRNILSFPTLTDRSEVTGAVGFHIKWCLCLHVIPTVELWVLYSQ